MRYLLLNELRVDLSDIVEFIQHNKLYVVVGVATEQLNINANGELDSSWSSTDLGQGVSTFKQDYL